MQTPAQQFVMDAALGTRVVVRFRLDDGFTDALGYLRERSETSCIVETKRGQIEIALADIQLAKAVPPPPERRSARHPVPVSALSVTCSEVDQS